MRLILIPVVFLLWLGGASAAPGAAQAYAAYLDEIARTDSLQGLYPFWTVNHVNEVEEEIRRAARIGRDPEKDQKMVLDQLKRRAAMTARDSVQAQSTGGRTVLTYRASDPHKDQAYRIVVDMLFEDGAWKVLRERMLFDKK